MGLLRHPSLVFKQLLAGMENVVVFPMVTDLEME